MNLNNYINLTQAMKELQKRGFTRTFNLENNQLKCSQTNKLYTSEEFLIIEYHRFPSDYQHLDKSIIFAVECQDGELGYIVSSEQNMNSINLLQLMDKVKIKPRQQNNIHSFKLDSQVRIAY